MPGPKKHSVSADEGDMSETYTPHLGPSQNAFDVKNLSECLEDKPKRTALEKDTNVNDVEKSALSTPSSRASGEREANLDATTGFQEAVACRAPAQRKRNFQDISELRDAPASGSPFPRWVSARRAKQLSEALSNH